MKAEWKLIDTAPKDGTTILVCEGKNIEPVTWDKDLNEQYVDEPVLDKYGDETNYMTTGGWAANGLTSHEETRQLYPTHWDYLPELPLAAGANGQ